MLPGFLPEQRHKITKLFAERKRKNRHRAKKKRKNQDFSPKSYASIVIYIGKRTQPTYNLKQPKTTESQPKTT